MPPQIQDQSDDDEWSQVQDIPEDIIITILPSIDIDRQNCNDQRCTIADRPCKSVYANACIGPMTLHSKLPNQGSYGTTWLATDAQGNDQYVVKQLTDSERNIMHEVSNQIRAARAGIAPPVLNFIIHNESAGIFYASIVMPRLEMTMTEYLLNNKDKELFISCYNEAKALLMKLSNIDILHMDARLDNFMIDRDGRWYLIDYGLSTSLLDGDIISNWINFYDSFSTFLSKQRILPKEHATWLRKFISEEEKDMLN